MKKAKAFMIDEKIYKEFRKIAIENGLVMSTIIENYLKTFIKKYQIDEKNM